MAERGAHYVLTVKGNQPTLHAHLRALPWQQVPVGDDTRDRGHGRVEWRTLKVTTVVAGLGFPHATQAVQIVRRRRPLNAKKGKKWSTETVYAVTSLTATEASAAELADIVRGHWAIEGSTHRCVEPDCCGFNAPSPFGLSASSSSNHTQVPCSSASMPQRRASRLTTRAQARRCRAARRGGPARRRPVVADGHSQPPWPPVQLDHELGGTG